MVCRIVVASPRRACVIRRGVGAAQSDASRWVARAGAPSKGREGRRRKSGRQREGDSRSQRRCVGGGGRLRRQGSVAGGASRTRCRRCGGATGADRDRGARQTRGNREETAMAVWQGNGVGVDGLYFCCVIQLLHLYGP